MFKSIVQKVRQCAQKLLDTEDKIDILINNAGLTIFPLIFPLEINHRDRTLAAVSNGSFTLATFVSETIGDSDT
jgi:hypothetical protein